MRTLRQLDNEAMDKAKARARELCGTENNYFGITENEIIAMQANAHFGDKYREMFHLLEEVEKFLNSKWEGPTGGWDEANAKDALKKKIAAV